MKLDRFSRRTLALALGMVAGYLTRGGSVLSRKNQDKDRYPNGFNRDRENARRVRQAKAGQLRFHRTDLPEARR